MPIYCYKCFDCEHYEEIKQGFEDEPLDTCPQCGEKQFKRVIRNVGVIFKGSGWHITDYSKKNILPASSGESSTASAETSTSDTTTKNEPKAEPKSETKTETKSYTASTPSSGEKN